MLISLRILPIQPQIDFVVLVVFYAGNTCVTARLIGQVYKVKECLRLEREEIIDFVV